MNPRYNYNFDDAIATVLRSHGMDINRIGYYLHYLIYFCIQAKFQNRSLSTGELEALERHLKFDADRWGITKPAVRHLTREKSKFLTNHILEEIVAQYFIGERGKFKTKTYFKNIPGYNQLPQNHNPVQYTHDPYNDKTVYGPYSDIT